MESHVSVLFPRTILPNNPHREPGWRSTSRDRNCLTLKKELRTKFLTQYVMDNYTDRTGVRLGTRLKTPSPKQHAYQTSAGSFLVVPSANGWTHVSDFLTLVDKAVVVTFNNCLSDLDDGDDFDFVSVWEVSSKLMRTMAQDVWGSRKGRSTTLSLPFFTRVAIEQSGNQQAKAGALEPHAKLLWTERLKWVNRIRDFPIETPSTFDMQAWLNQLTGTGKRLVLDLGGATITVDPEEIVSAQLA